MTSTSGCVPSGEAGPVAVAVGSFVRYNAESAVDLGAYGADPRRVIAGDPGWRARSAGVRVL